MPPDADLRIRPAGPADAASIAGLHTLSWRATYRGMLSDTYLDGPIAGERRAFWLARLGAPPPGLVTLLAFRGEAPPLGFVCALVDHHPTWGTLIDNLHVQPDLKGSGIGRALMRAAATALAERGACGAVYLTVLRANGNARAFYARLGGTEVEQMDTVEADGAPQPVSRIAWTSLAAFTAAIGGR